MLPVAQHCYRDTLIAGAGVIASCGDRRHDATANTFAANKPKGASD